MNGSGLARLPPSEMKEMATDSVPLRRLSGTRDLRLGTKDIRRPQPSNMPQGMARDVARRKFVV